MREEEKVGERDYGRHDLADISESAVLLERIEKVRTDDRPTPVRTPRPRISHHKKAPTRPAPPVPEAKYLEMTQKIQQSVTDVWRSLEP